MCRAVGKCEICCEEKVEWKEKKGGGSVRELWSKLRKLPEKIGKKYPPGYDYKAEHNAMGALLGVGIGMNVSFFVNLHEAYERLFAWITFVGLGETQLRYSLKPDAVVEPFCELVQGYWWWYLPWLVALVVTVALHYMHYYRGTKSIYVMRRLKSPSVVAKSCLVGTLIQLLIGLVVMVGIFWLYYGIYYAVIPNACNPRLF